MQLKSTAYYPAIDCLRFVTACLVVLYHFGDYQVGSPSAVPLDRSNPTFPFLDLFVQAGSVGVQIFFVISGLMISISMEKSESLVGFMRDRFLRLFPALWIATVISACFLSFAGLGNIEILERFIRSIFLMPPGPHVDGVIWTLRIEVVFYLLAGLCLWKRYFFGFALVFGSLSAAYHLLSELSVRGYDVATQIVDALTLRLLVLEHGVFFAMGMLVWVAYRTGVRPSIVLPFLIFFLAGLRQIFHRMEWDSFDSGFSIMLFGGALLCIIGDIRTTKGVARASGLPRFLGQMSYALYLGHFVNGAVAVFAFSTVLGFSTIATFASSLLVIAVISLLIWHLETKLRRFMRSAFFSSSKFKSFA